MSEKQKRFHVVITDEETGNKYYDVITSFVAGVFVDEDDDVTGLRLISCDPARCLGAFAGLRKLVELMSEEHPFNLLDEYEKECGSAIVSWEEVKR